MKRRANKVKKVNYLELIPLHSEKIKSTVDSEGNITILIENKGIFYWITQKLLKKPRVSQIHLDKMGNFIHEALFLRAGRIATIAREPR